MAKRLAQARDGWFCIQHLSPLDSPRAISVDLVFRNLDSRPHFLEKICFRDREMECPVWGTTMVRRRVFYELGCFNAKYGFWSDFDMWFRIAERQDVAFVPEKLIDLPSRQAMPHLFDSKPLRAHSVIFRMYWAARCRHYQGKPLTLSRALVTQIVDSSSLPRVGECCGERLANWQALASVLTRGRCRSKSHMRLCYGHSLALKWPPASNAPLICVNLPPLLSPSAKPRKAGHRP